MAVHRVHLADAAALVAHQRRLIAASGGRPRAIASRMAGAR